MLNKMTAEGLSALITKFYVVNVSKFEEIETRYLFTDAPHSILRLDRVVFSVGRFPKQAFLTGAHVKVGKETFTLVTVHVGQVEFPLYPSLYDKLPFTREALARAWLGDADLHEFPELDFKLND